MKKIAAIALGVGVLVFLAYLYLHQSPAPEGLRSQAHRQAPLSARDDRPEIQPLSALDYSRLTNWLLAPFDPRTETGFTPGYAQEGIRSLGTNALPELLALVRQQGTNLPHAGGMAVVGFTALKDIATPAVGALVACLDDPRPEVRSAAAESLGGMGPSASSALPGLLKALRDKEPRVRICAVQALISIPGRPEQVVPPVVEFLERPHEKSDLGEWEQVAGIAVLQWNYVLSATQAIPVLRRMTNDPSTIIRKRASDLLGTVGKPETPRNRPYDDYLYRKSQAS
jgi:hypothetical protein